MAKEREFVTDDEHEYVQCAIAKQNGGEGSVRQGGQTWRGAVVSIWAGHENGKLRYHITLRLPD